MSSMFHKLSPIDRPSQAVNRAYVTGFQDAAILGAILYTPTAGKTLYVTSIILTAINSSTTTSGQLQIRDNTTVRIPIVIGQAGVAALSSLVQAAVTSMTFPEPVRFSTNFNTNVSLGIVQFSIVFTGYEE